MKKSNFIKSCLSPISLAILYSLSNQAVAQQENPKIDDELEIIEVTGIRGSLNRAIANKRASTLTTESINAEDIGKFPDLNLAESLQRISGVAITRDNGEGQQISLRGLGPSFARVLWNGVPISTASNGGTDVGAEDREFDFDVFSSDLFSEIDVSKSAAAHQMEGGVSGIVNLRNVRPFDYDGGPNATVIYKHGFHEVSDSSDPNFTAIVSNTFLDDTFGALVGVTTQKRGVRVDGYESQNWVSQEARGFTYDLSDGNNSGLSDSQLDSLLLPRLPRTESQYGERDRISYVAALQYRPSDKLEVNLDILGSTLDSNIQRHNFDASIRSSKKLVPLNAVAGDNNIVKSITLLNVDRRSENRAFNQQTDQVQAALSATWYVNDEFKVDAIYSHATSDYEVQEITFLATAYDTDIMINIPDGSRPIPEVSTTTDITDPANFNMDLLRGNFIYSEEKDDAFKIDATWGDERSNIRFGIAKHTFQRDQDYDRLTAAPSAVFDYEAELSEYASVLPFDNFLSVLGAGSGVTKNHLIVAPADAAEFYDFDVMADAADVRDAGTYDAKESSLSAYVEVNHTTEFLKRELRINAGSRLVSTDVDVAAPFQGDSAKLSTSYTELLPSFNIAFDVAENVVARLGAARTMTRPTVTAMVPRTSVSSNFTISTGNPDLDPYISNQIDLGVEWYFNNEAVLAVSYFDKSITGFIQNGTTPGVFGDAGIPLSTLDPQIFSGVTLDTPFDFTRPLNVPDVTTISGWEFLYQQPLSFIAEGVGAMVNFSKVNGNTTFIAGNGDVVPSNIVGLSDYSYNIVLYYETDSFSVRGSYNYRDDYTAADCCVNGQPLLRTRQGSGQFDMSATYVLPFAENVTLTLEGINLNDNDEYTYFGDEGMIQRYVGTGRQIFVGARATF